MSVEELLLRLKQKQINVELDAGNLRVRSVDGLPLDQVWIDLIKANKQEIIGYFNNASQTRTLTYQPITKIPDNKYYEISHAQRRVLILSQFEDAALAYNCFIAKKLLGNLDLMSFQKAYDHLMIRHESHRTVFKMVKGVFKQKILDFEQDKYKIEYHDLRQDQDPEAQCASHVSEYRDYFYNFEQGPLLKAGIFQLEDWEYIFMFSIHHVISDGWSLKVFFNELITLYEAFCRDAPNPLPILQVQYKDFTVWENTLFNDHQAMGEHKAYWQSKFKEKPIRLLSLTDYPRPDKKSYCGDKLSVDLGSSTLDRLHHLSQRFEASLFMILLSSVKLLLHKYTGNEDITIGTAVAGREHPDLENQIGFYINTLALRTQFSKNEQIGSFFHKVKQTILEAYQHQMYPFDLLVDNLDYQRKLCHSPLFDVSVVLQNTESLKRLRNGITASILSDLKLADYETQFNTSIYDLSFRFTEKEQDISLDLIYNTDLFEHSRIEQMVDHLKNVIAAIVQHKRGLIKDLSYISQSEIQALLSIIGQ